MPYFEGAEGTTLNNPTLWDIAGSATFNDYQILFINHIAGITPIPDLRESVQKQALQDSIRALPRAKAAYDDYTPSDKRRVICLEGTREALLREIAEWITAFDQPKIYVLFGPAGFGKSTIAQTIAERADKLLFLGASFFFSRDDVERRTAERFFTTIAFQLCGYNKEFAQAIGAILQTERGSASMSKTPLEQLNTLILDPLKGIIKSRSPPIVIIIDALDECDDADAWAILEAMNRLVQQFPSFKIFLTTRPHPHLAPLSDDPIQGGHRVFHLQCIEDRIIEGDISLFLKYNLSHEQVDTQLPKLRKPWSASEQDIESIVQAAGRLFIIASTAVRFILDKVEYNPVSQVNILRTQGQLSLGGLDSFYITILRRAVPKKSNRKIVDRFKIVIGSILALPKCLPIKTLEHFTYPWCSDDIDAVLKNLQSVITVNNDTPLIYHKSFSDFLTDADRCQDENLQIIPKDNHTRLAIRCLRIMNERLKRNILDLTGPIQYMVNDDALATKELKDQLEEKIPPELRHACTYWVHHLANGDNANMDAMAELETFAKEHLLHWFEALSWIDGLALAHRDLIALLRITKLLSLHELFFDGLRLISRFYETIRKSALHVYHSGLAFTPTKSLLSKKTSRDIGLCNVFGGPTSWGANIATIYHDRDWNHAFHVQFSNDSSKFAFLRSGSVRLWDATSGTPIRTFDGDMHALSSDFSTIAISQGTSVVLNNVASHIRIATFDHPANVIRLALSFDGTRVAVGLTDRTVKLWDKGRHDHVASLEAYSDSHRQLEFSPSGYTLAFASIDNTIHLWDGAGGKFIGNLGYQLDSHSRFTFSQDGSRLASCIQTEEGACLALWTVRNELIGMASGRWSAFAISPQGSLLATSDRSKVHVWSGEGGNPLPKIATFNPHMSVGPLALSCNLLAVGCVFTNGNAKIFDLGSHAWVATVQSCFLETLTFSPDCTRLVAGERSGCLLALWDVPGVMSSASSSYNDSRCITALAISPDGFRLAAGFEDGALELWDIAHTGKQLAGHKEHLEDVNIVAFCPTGERLASGSRDATVRLWNGRDGTLIGVLGHGFSFLTSLAFSRYALAIAAKDNVTLWDLKTLGRIDAFECVSYQISLSTDGSMLAFTSRAYPGSEVELWSLRDRTKVDTLQFTTEVAKTMFSPDGSQFAVQFKTGILELFKVVDGRVTAAKGKDIDLDWLSVPRWGGFTISLGYQNGAYLLLGRTPDCDHPFRLLQFPDNVGVDFSAVGPSLFALRYTRGPVVFIHPSTSSYFFPSLM